MTLLTTIFIERTSARMKTIVFLFFFSINVFSSFGQCPIDNDSLLIHCVNVKKQTIQFFWKDDKGQLFRNFGNLKTWLDKKGQHLVFAMNGGMYKTDNSPLGLFIDSGKTISSLNKASASGNFYLKPNGVFFINEDNTVGISTTENFKPGRNIKYATQSGPMLVIDGKIHPAFTQGSANVNIRNGVGILPNGELMFVLSKRPINFYDFAECFRKAGCRNALFLDGFVSRAYLPSKNWNQTDGDFGVIIAETNRD